MSEILEELNDAQRKAVLHDSGPLVIFAGPGTGKTRVTTRKIAYLLKEKNYTENQILALTFSEKAAEEMKDRVKELVPEAHDLHISTFHSFCNTLIRENSLDMEINASARLISDEYQKAFLLENFDNMGFEYVEIPRNPTELARTTQGAIARFKQENITVEELEEWLDNNEDEEYIKLHDLLKAYKAYEEYKLDNDFIDFGDMQMLALKLLSEKPLVLKKYVDRFKYIIVDEFQDTDFIQLQILFKLCPSGKIMVVGDDDQSIYRFRGAYLTNIQEFNQNYNEISDVVLDINYRCTPPIQEVASTLIKNNKDRKDKDIRTNKEEGGMVKVMSFQSEWDQAGGIVAKVKELLDADIPKEEIAILVRRRLDAIPIIEMMSKAGISLEFIGSKQYFKSSIVKAVAAYLQVLNDPDENHPELAHVMMRPVHGFVPGEVRKLSKYARDKQLSLWGALNDLGDYDGDASRFQEFRDFLNSLFNIKDQENLSDLVRAIMFGKDLFRPEIKKGGMQGLENVRLLNRFLKLTTEFEEVRPGGDLEAFLHQIEVFRRLGLEDEPQDPGAGKVHFLTIHGAKGKEFPHVFIPCLNERHLPSTFKSYKFDIPDDLGDGLLPSGSNEDLHYEEERRLLYVAITRGKEMVYLSNVVQYSNNKRPAKVSRYLEEIKKGTSFEEVYMEPEDIQEAAATDTSAVHDRLVQMIGRGEWEEAKEAFAALAKLHDAEIGMDVDVDAVLEKVKVLEKEVVEEHVKEIEFSPSKLDTYDKCPCKYWYQYVLEIPGKSRDFFSLGTLVHAVIEGVTRRKMDGFEVTVEEALEMLEKAWRPSVYESVKVERQDHAKAVKMIEDFMVRQEGKKGETIDVETWIGFEKDGVKFHGKVDRVDELDGKLVVVDYKSGKGKKSRPELRRDFQMALYSIGAAEKYEKDVAETGHWYLLHDKEVMVSMSKEELDSVLSRAKEIVEGIHNGMFPANPEHYKCQWCDYKDLCDNAG